jgi:Mn-dependent DtxR family transcriptional regulator
MNSTRNKTTFILEDYLKAIAVLKRRNGKATVTALIRMIGVKKSSIYRSLNKLAFGYFISLAFSMAASLTVSRTKVELKVAPVTASTSPPLRLK